MDYCTNCGARIFPTTRFCGKCGAATETEETRLAPSEETRLAATARRVESPAPARAVAPAVPGGGEPEELERVVFKVRPTLLFIKIGYALAALGGLLLIALLAYFTGNAVPLWVSIPLALALLLIPALYHLRRNMVSYTLTDSKIEIDQGLVSRTTRNLPLRNIQDVTVTSTVFQRLLRFGNLVVDNASEEGGTTVLRNIPDPRRHADLLLRELRRWH